MECDFRPSVLHMVNGAKGAACPKRLHIHVRLNLMNSVLNVMHFVKKNDECCTKNDEFSGKAGIYEGSDDRKMMTVGLKNDDFGATIRCGGCPWTQPTR